MVVGARSAADELLKKWVLDVAELKKADVRLNVEHALNKRQQPSHEHACEQRTEHSVKADALAEDD